MLANKLSHYRVANVDVAEEQPVAQIAAVRKRNLNRIRSLPGNGPEGSCQPAAAVRRHLVLVLVLVLALVLVSLLILSRLGWLLKLFLPLEFWAPGTYKILPFQIQTMRLNSPSRSWRYPSNPSICKWLAEKITRIRRAVPSLLLPLARL
jgi:hypothetical protein